MKSKIGIQVLALFFALNQMVPSSFIFAEAPPPSPGQDQVIVPPPEIPVEAKKQADESQAKKVSVEDQTTTDWMTQSKISKAKEEEKEKVILEAEEQSDKDLMLARSGAGPLPQPQPPQVGPIPNPQPNPNPAPNPQPNPNPVPNPQPNPAPLPQPQPNPNPNPVPVPPITLLGAALPPASAPQPAILPAAPAASALGAPALPTSTLSLTVTPTTVTGGIPAGTPITVIPTTISISGGFPGRTPITTPPTIQPTPPPTPVVPLPTANGILVTSLPPSQTYIFPPPLPTSPVLPPVNAPQPAFALALPPVSYARTPVFDRNLFEQFFLKQGLPAGDIKNLLNELAAHVQNYQFLDGTNQFVPMSINYSSYPGIPGVYAGFTGYSVQIGLSNNPLGAGSIAKQQVSFQIINGQYHLSIVIDFDNRSIPLYQLERGFDPVTGVIFEEYNRVYENGQLSSLTFKNYNRNTGELEFATRILYDRNNLASSLPLFTESVTIQNGQPTVRSYYAYTYFRNQFNRPASVLVYTFDGNNNLLRVDQTRSDYDNQNNLHRETILTWADVNRPPTRQETLIQYRSIGGNLYPAHQFVMRFNQSNGPEFFSVESNRSTTGISFVLDSMREYRALSPTSTEEKIWNLLRGIPPSISGRQPDVTRNVSAPLRDIIRQLIGQQWSTLIGL